MEDRTKVTIFTSTYRVRGYTRPSYNLIEVTPDVIRVTLRYPGEGESMMGELDRHAMRLTTSTDLEASDQTMAALFQLLPTVLPTREFQLQFIINNGIIYWPESAQFDYGYFDGAFRTRPSTPSRCSSRRRTRGESSPSSRPRKSRPKPASRYPFRANDQSVVQQHIARNQG